MRQNASETFVLQSEKYFFKSKYLYIFLFADYEVLSVKIYIFLESRKFCSPNCDFSCNMVAQKLLHRLGESKMRQKASKNICAAIS